MKSTCAIVLLLAPASLFAQIPDANSIPALIKKLGSSQFQERDAAMKVLLQRPDAAPALRDALRSPDRELAKRAEEILDYLDRAPIRELNEAVKNGHADRVIQSIAEWPPDKYDLEVWLAARQFAKTIDAIHFKQHGKRIGDISKWEVAPTLIAEKRVTENLKNYPRRGNYIIRAAEVDMAFTRLKKPMVSNRFEQSDVFFVVTKSVRLESLLAGRTVVFAGGSVEMSGFIINSVIICGGDATFDGELHGSLIVARGNVSLESPGLCGDCRIICGKSLITKNKKRVRDSHVSENDRNPLGFIRWTDAAKDKPAPKAK